MANFQYEWWTVDIRYHTGIYHCEFKGKNKDNIIKQIEKEIKYTNSNENLSKPWFLQENRIIEVYWDTLKLDRKGYQRLY